MARPKKLLTAMDIATLNSITRGDSTAAVGYRLAAVRAYVSHSAEEVASFFDTEPETVIRWASKFHSSGVQGLENRSRGHRAMKLAPETQAQVREWLESDRDASGACVHWTLRRLCLEVRKVFRVSLSVAAMGSTLKKMGMVLKRPRPMHCSSSSEAREEFKKNLPAAVARLKHEVEAEEVELVFQDESRFGTLTTLGRSWKRKGEDFEVKTKMGRENLYVFGAVTPSSGSLFAETYGKSNTEAMDDFLKKFSARNAGRHVVMLLDRAGWHTTGKLEIPENISPVFLPPVSPQLNPIERLWKKIKTDFFHNRIHDGIEDVKASITKALTTLTATDVASICACSYLDACL